MEMPAIGSFPCASLTWFLSQNAHAQNRAFVRQVEIVPLRKGNGEVQTIQTVRCLFSDVLGKPHLVSVFKILGVYSNEPRTVIVLANVEGAGIV